VDIFIALCIHVVNTIKKNKDVSESSKKNYIRIFPEENPMKYNSS
jgi:hypothetical protein